MFIRGLFTSNEVIYFGKSRTNITHFAGINTDSAVTFFGGKEFLRFTG